MIVLLMTYMNRSGSTFLANLLSSSDNVCVCPEGDWLVERFLEAPDKRFTLEKESLDIILQAFRKDEKLSTWKMDPGWVQSLTSCSTNLEAFLAILIHYSSLRKPLAGILLFKAERLAALISKIEKAKQEINHIKYLCLARDPRGIIASQKQTFMPGGFRRMNSNTVYAALQWRKYFHDISNACKAENTSLIQYENLIKDPVETLNTFTDQQKLEMPGLNPEKGDLLNRLPSNHKMIHPLVGSPAVQGRISAWKQLLDVKDIFMIERTCSTGMKHLNYLKASSGLNPGFEIIRILNSIGYFITRMAVKARFHFRNLI